MIWCFAHSIRVYLKKKKKVRKKEEGGWWEGRGELITFTNIRFVFYCVHLLLKLLPASLGALLYVLLHAFFMYS